MVLDIAGRLPAKGQFVPLVIRGASSSRGETQTWRFSDVSETTVALPQGLPSPHTHTLLLVNLVDWASICVHYT